MSVRSTALGLCVSGLLALGVQAADLSPGAPPAPVRISGLEALQPDDAASDMAAHVGVATLIVLFADDPDDADFLAQVDILRSRAADLADRDVVLLTDTAPAGNGPLRQALRPRGFSLILIDSNGTLAQRRGSVTDAARLLRQIDEMP